MNMMVYIVQHNFPPRYPEGPLLAPHGSEGRDIPVNNSYHSRVMCNARTQSWLVDEERREENFQNFQSPTMKNDLIIDGMFASLGSPEKRRKKEKREHHSHANDH